MCLHVLTKTLPFKFIGVALWLLNSQWKMHHCDVLCLILSSLCSLPAYNYAEHLGSSKMPLVCAPCLPVLLLYSSFLIVCFVGLYAGHPYIQLISFKIFLLSCLCTFYNNNIITSIPPTLLTRAPPTLAKKRCL